VSDRKLKAEILRDVQTLYGSRLSGGGGGGGIEALTGDVTASGTGSVTATIAADAVTNAKLANMAANTLKGNNTGGSANPTDLTVSQVKTLLAISTSDVSGLGTLATQSGTFSGTSSGTNTGDQTSVSGNAGTATALQTGRTIAITGDVAYTSPAFDGTGNVTAAGTIQSGAVTLGKMANLAANSIVGNNTGSPATPLALTTAQVKTLLAIAAGDVSGLGTLATQSGTFSGTSSGTNTGDNAVNSLYSGLVSNATHTGEVTGATALTIANDAVTYAKMQNTLAGNVVLARADAAAGDIGEVSLAASQLLGRGSTGNVAAITVGSGLSMSGTTLSASGGGISDGDKGDITVSASGATWTIDNGAVTLAKVANVAANSFLANATGSPATVQEIATTRIPLFAGAITGTPSGTTYLRGDGAWATPAGGSGGDASFLFGGITTTSQSSTASWAAVTGSAITVVAGRTYSLRWRLRTYSAAATTGLRLRRVLGGGAVGTVLGWHALVMNAAVAMNGRASREGTVDTTSGASLGNATSSTTDSGTHWVDCLFTCTTGGTIGLEMQTEVNTSSCTIDGDGSYWEAVWRTT
jgi:hypothetical protein